MAYIRGNVASNRADPVFGRRDRGGSGNRNTATRRQFLKLIRQHAHLLGTLGTRFFCSCPNFTEASIVVIMVDAGHTKIAVLIVLVLVVVLVVDRMRMRMRMRQRMHRSGVGWEKGLFIVVGVIFAVNMSIFRSSFE